MHIQLNGRTALITGASQGLGKAMAQRFAESGANVLMLARRTDVLEAAVDEVRTHVATQLGGNASPRIEGYSCDVANAESIAATWAAISGQFPAVDIVVNNAGQAQTGAFEDVTDAIWQADLDLKLFAAIRLTRLAWPGMKARNWGRVVNLLNTAAKAPPPKSAPTSVTRAAGMALTKVLAGEGAPHNICVNALMIGRIVSNQIEQQWEHSAGGRDSSVSLREFIAETGRRLPMGRMGEPEECANLACFLVSDAASYVTGCAINMDGGLSQVV